MNLDVGHINFGNSATMIIVYHPSTPGTNAYQKLIEISGDPISHYSYAFKKNLICMYTYTLYSGNPNNLHKCLHSYNIFGVIKIGNKKVLCNMVSFSDTKTNLAQMSKFLKQSQNSDTFFSRSTSSTEIERESCLTEQNVAECDEDTSGHKKWSKCTRRHFEYVTKKYVQHRLNIQNHL